MLDFLGNLERTHMCGELRAADAGQPVVVMGWVNRRRDHGDLIFLDLRDRTGITQVVVDKSNSGEALAKAEASRPEYVIAAIGTVRVRGEGLTNPNMPTGDIEVVCSELLLLSEDAVAAPNQVVNLAVVYAWTNEVYLAFETLTPLIKIPSGILYGGLKREAYWDPLRPDPRFEKLLAELAPRD